MNSPTQQFQHDRHYLGLTQPRRRPIRIRKPVLLHCLAVTWMRRVVDRWVRVRMGARVFGWRSDLSFFELGRR